LPECVENPQRRRCIGGAATDTGSNRQILRKRNRCANPASRLIGEGTGRAQHQIVRPIVQRRSKRTIQRQGQRFRRLDPDKVMDFGEDDQAVEFVIAIVTTTNDMKIKVDFGWR
jgi:hypothetical protein